MQWVWVWSFPLGLVTFAVISAFKELCIPQLPYGSIKVHHGPYPTPTRQVRERQMMQLDILVAQPQVT